MGRKVWVVVFFVNIGPLLCNSKPRNPRHCQGILRPTRQGDREMSDLVVENGIIPLASP